MSVAHFILNQQKKPWQSISTKMSAGKSWHPLLGHFSYCSVAIEVRFDWCNLPDYCLVRMGIACRWRVLTYENRSWVFWPSQGTHNFGPLRRIRLLRCLDAIIAHVPTMTSCPPRNHKNQLCWGSADAMVTVFLRRRATLPLQVRKHRAVITNLLIPLWEEKGSDLSSFSVYA